MDVTETKIPGVKIIQPVRHADPRGVFVETYQQTKYAAAGIDAQFVQDNLIANHKTGTIRGLHFQRPPAAQAKLVYVVRGSIFDVAVDIRHGSPTFGQWVSAHLTAADQKQIFLPVGIAHGYSAMEDDTEVAYKVSADYAPDMEAGLAWDDADLAIAWPRLKDDIVIADRDRSLPALAALEPLFQYP